MYETEHKKDLYMKQKVKKDIPELSDAELDNSPADEGTDKLHSQLSGDEKFEVMPIYSGPPPQWNFPVYLDELA